MNHKIQLAKWKWIWTKDIDLNKVHIWVNWPTKLWQELLWWNKTMKLIVWDSILDCYLWDSTTPIRWTNNDDVLIQLMIDIEPILIWALLSHELTLIVQD